MKFLLLGATSFAVQSFQFSIHLHQHQRSADLQLFMTNNNGSIDLKAELKLYLQKREELDADEIAKQNVGKVVGGTQGNAVLDFFSIAPGKTYTIEDVPDIFDYGELIKYGFGHLVDPIMDAGGRFEMYPLMGLPPPVPPRVEPIKPAPELTIDKTGKYDPARYSGLKVTQVLDDEEIGRRLAEVQRKKKNGEEPRPKLMEEDYEVPFSDKQNISPRMTPDWTPEKLDEEGRKRGKALAWARKAREGEFRKDPYESLNIEGNLQRYSIVTVPFIAFAFGNASSKFLELLNLGDQAHGLLDLMKGPALVIMLAAIGSGIYCGAVLAPGKNRSVFVWGLKGVAGGPLTIIQLNELDKLMTRGEIEKGNKISS